MSRWILPGSSKCISCTLMTAIQHLEGISYFATSRRSFSVCFLKTSRYSFPGYLTSPCNEHNFLPIVVHMKIHNRQKPFTYYYICMLLIAVSFVTFVVWSNIIIYLYEQIKQNRREVEKMNQTVHRDKQYQNRASLTNPKQLSVLFNHGLFGDEGSGRCREDTWFESAVSYLFCNDRYLQIPKKPQRNMRNKEYDTLAFPISYLESR